MIIAVDFDGTLCTERYPEIGDPIPGVIKLVQKLHKKGNTIILYTCRTGEYLDDAVRWCQARKIPIDYVNENVPERIAYYGGADSRKISADIYIEDRAVNLSYNWKRIKELVQTNSKTIKELQEFWNPPKSEPKENKVKKTEALKICEGCIHATTCKYHDEILEKAAALEIGAPFEVTCKYKNTGAVTPPSWTPWKYPSIGDDFKPIPLTAPSYCKSCGFWQNGKCEAPNNIAGLPCQQITCQLTSDNSTNLITTNKAE